MPREDIYCYFWDKFLTFPIAQDNRELNSIGLWYQNIFEIPQVIIIP